MLRTLFTDLFRLRKFTGVDLRILGDGQMTISFCSLQVKGDQLGVTVKQEGLKNILHFSKHLKPGPIALHLAGKGVLTKKLERVEKLDQQVIHQILPNANAGDFYFQHRQVEGSSLVSMIRRKDADELIVAFAAQGFSVIALSLDAFAENAAYQSALQILVQDEEIVAKSPALTKRKTEVFAKAKLLGIAIIAGPSLLLFLLINFFMFSHYTAALQACAAKSTTSAAEISRYKSMETELGNKTAFIEHAGWTSGLSPAFLIDQLLSAMSPQIKLVDLAVNPIEIKTAGSIAGQEFNSNTVKISGTCSDASVLNNWMFAIKANNWVQSCRLDNYAVNNENGKGLFSITIMLKEDEK